MPITIWRGLAAALRSQGTVILQVRSPADPAVLAGALAAARAGIEELGYWVTPPGDSQPGEWEAPEVAGPVPVPGGCLLIIHAGNPAQEMILDSIPGILTRRLGEAGITDAKVSPAPRIGDRYEELHHSLGPVVRAVLCGPGRVRFRQPVPRLEPRLIDIAAGWLPGMHRPGNELHALISAVEVPVSWQTLPPVVTAALTAEPFVSVISSDFATSMASIVLGDCQGQGVALSAAGADWPGTEIAARMRGLREVIRSHADVPELSWAFVAPDPENRYLWITGPSDPDETGVQPAWYQLLSAGRLRRLGGPPRGSVQLPGGRFELTVGEPDQWVPGHPDNDAIRAHAQDLLSGSSQ